jgi:transposase
MSDTIHTDTLHVIHARAAGLDVHKMQITATVRLARPGAEAETHTRTVSALPAGLGELVDWLLDHRVSAAVMEATGVYWESVFEALESAGIDPLLVHAQHVKQLKGRKTDLADSLWLARICQFGLCNPSFVPPADFRALRKVSRQRHQVVRLRATLRTRIHQVLDGAGLRIGGLLSDLFGVNGRRILDGLVAGCAPEDILAGLSGHVRPRLAALGDALSAPLRPHARFVLQDQLAAFGQAEARIATYDAFIAQQLTPYQSQLDLLMTLPGIDHGAARAILIELGPDMQVFPSSRHCAAWAGLCPGNNESAGKRRHGHTRKGNPFLRTLLIECAHGAARTKHCQFQGYHKALTVRRGYKRATVATAHKLLRILYRMLATNQPYHDPHTDYEALMVKRNAPRWIKMLEKYGYHTPDRDTALPDAA